jgi:hypothetical protein
MTAEEKDLLNRLHLGDETAIRQFSRLYRNFIRKDVFYHERLGLIHAEQGREVISQVTNEFIELAVGFDLSESDLTIEQFLHLLTVNRVYDRRHGERSSIYHLYRESSPYIGHDISAMSRLALDFIKGDTIIKANEHRFQLIQADTEHPLTPGYLATHLAPYLNALASIQHTCDDMLGREHREVVIRRITQQSPVSISLQGVADAVNAVLDLVVPWRRENAKKLAALRIKEIEADIKIKEEEAKVRSTKDLVEAKKTEAEIEKLIQEKERQRIENAKLEVEVGASRFDLALRMAAKMNRRLPKEQQIAYALKMLSDLKELTASEIEVKLLKE